MLKSKLSCPSPRYGALMEGHSLDTKNGADRLSDLDCRSSAPRPAAIIDVNIVWPACARWAVDVQKIALYHRLKSGASVVAALLELWKPALLVGSNKLQNLVLDGIQAFHMRTVYDLENEVTRYDVVGVHGHCGQED